MKYSNRIELEYFTNYSTKSQTNISKSIQTILHVILYKPKKLFIEELLNRPQDTWDESLEFHGKPGKQTKVQRELKRRWRGRRSNSDENGVKHGRGHDKEGRVVEKTRKLLTKIGDGG
ncbi:hypothetical protein QLX08_005931 [Tetragonisca angustula]|uniref:Uncharacterized protein n=1 Tax=Tetragonisca angustula TaxID=166442 RepID=A0AAW0ZWE9_9HYME